MHCSQSFDTHMYTYTFTHEHHHALKKSRCNKYVLNETLYAYISICFGFVSVMLFGCIDGGGVKLQVSRIPDSCLQACEQQQQQKSKT